MTPSGAMPALWLCGPPGAGKTTVGWELFRRLREDGVEAAYVDIDQLGMCYPEPASDPGRYVIKARNLAAIAPNHAAAGARCLVVSGVAGGGVRRELLPGLALTVCRLGALGEELRRRLRERDGAEARAEARETGDEAGADLDLDTTGLSVPAAGRRVRARTGWPGPGTAAPMPPTGAVRAAGRILWLCGAAGAGKSRVGWEVFLAVRRAGFRAAYLDLDQLGFRAPGPPGDGVTHLLKARNLAAVWRTFHGAGARRLVMVGPVPDAATAAVYAGAVPASAMTLCRLHASAGELARRIELRGERRGWPAPGDPLKGLPAPELRRAAAGAAADAARMERAGLGDVRVATDGVPPADLAAEVLARTWG